VGHAGEGRANHYGDTLFGAFAIADMKNRRTLPAREVLAARRSALASPPKAAGRNANAGRAFVFATNRR